LTHAAICSKKDTSELILKKETFMAAAKPALPTPPPATEVREDRVLTPRISPALHSAIVAGGGSISYFDQLSLHYGF
jgi:hypothetical protein